MDELAGYLSSVSGQSDSESKTKKPKASTSTAMETSPDTDSSDNDEDEDHKPSHTTNLMSKIASAVSAKTSSSSDINRFKYIPMRLSEEERRMLNVLLSALEVCEYTDVVDVTFSHTRKSKYSRIIESLVDILSISSGLMLANNLTKGESLVAGKSLNDNVPFFSDLFEVRLNHHAKYIQYTLALTALSFFPFFICRLDVDTRS